MGYNKTNEFEFEFADRETGVKRKIQEDHLELPVLCASGWSMRDKQVACGHTPGMSRVLLTPCLAGK